MRVALLSPPYLQYYMRNARCDFVSLSKTQWYPIWLGYCGAYLEKMGHIVKLIDAPSYGLDHQQTRSIIKDFKPEFLVIYTGRLSEDNDIEFGDKIVDDLSIPGVIVGPYASIHPEEALKKTMKINFLIDKEFEHPVAELIDGRNYSNIKNLVYKDNGEVKKNENRPLLNQEELDEIPFVTAFFNKHLDTKYYKAISEHFPYIDLMTGRGCAWGKCSYCLWVHSFITGSVYRMRSIENVIAEFKYIITNMPHIRSVMIQDDTFTEDRAMEFCQAKLKENIKIPWSCYARANMSYEVLELMKRAGCRNLHVGYESANPQVLKNIKKGLSVDIMTKFTENAKKTGLRIHADFAIGFNGETVEGIEKTIEWSKKLDPDTAQFQLMIPFPSTPFYNHLKETNCLTESGEPDYPNLSNDEIRRLGKKAYREFYLSWRYFKRVLRHPYEHFFGRLDTIMKAIPAMFWEKWST